MIEVKSHKGNTFEKYSRYEILFDLHDLEQMNKAHKELRRCRIYGDIILYFILVVWGVGGGFAMLATGILWSNARNLVWGLILLALSLPYSVLRGAYIRRAFFILYEDGVATVILNKKRRIKYDGKRFWFTYIPFEAISGYEIKDISSEFKSLVFHTKDGKYWPDKRVGITYSKGKCRKYFAKTAIDQYKKWKKYNTSGDEDELNS